MRLLVLGAMLCLVVGCRADKPPALSLICIGDGYGGADCVDSSGQKVYKKPSELTNFWMTTQVDMNNFAAWCYKTSVENAADRMKEIEGSTR